MLRTFAVYFVIGVVHFVFREKFLAISFDAEAAKAAMRVTVARFKNKPADDEREVPS